MSLPQNKWLEVFARTQGKRVDRMIVTIDLMVVLLHSFFHLFWSKILVFYVQLSTSVLYRIFRLRHYKSESTINCTVGKVYLCRVKNTMG